MEYKAVKKYENGTFDDEHFLKMTSDELYDYFVYFFDYNLFLEKEKLTFIPENTFNEWIETIYFVNMMPLTSTIFSENITYDDRQIINVLIQKYKRYKKYEILRIAEEFQICVQEHNKKILFILNQ